MMRRKNTGPAIDLFLSKLPDHKASGTQWRARCPAHDDKNPSLSIAEGDDSCVLLTCHAGCTTNSIVNALGLNLSDLYVSDKPSPWYKAGNRSRPARNGKRPAFTAEMAEDSWRKARLRARDDLSVDEDRVAYDYLAQRGLMESWELGLVGILAPGMDLPEAISRWPRNGYRLLSPLYDLQGQITNVQSRAIVAAQRKTLFPVGSKSKGTAFASSSGLELLRGRPGGVRTVLLAEGLTDYLALSSVATVPVLAAPGSGMAEYTVGPWARNLDIVLALDDDEAGRKAISPTARKLHKLEARSVHALVWPKGCCDACDALEALGEGGLFEFLARHLLEVAA